MPSRFSLIRVAIFLLVILFMAWLSIVVRDWVSVSIYLRRASSINDKICALQQRRPVDVAAKPWQSAIGWASIAHCNICATPSHCSYEAMCNYEKELDAKLQGHVDLQTIAWIFEKLSDTGPHGRRYIIRFKPEWKYIFDEENTQLITPQEPPVPGPYR